MPTVDEYKAELVAYMRRGGNFKDDEGKRIMDALQHATENFLASESTSDSTRSRPESPPPGLKMPDVEPPTPLTSHQMHSGVQPRAFGASIVSFTASARNMVKALECKVAEVDCSIGSLTRDFRTKLDMLKTAEADFDDEVQTNQKKLVNIARMQFEVKHSQQEILPEYERAKINSSKAVEEAKSKMDEAVALHKALVAQESFANSCVSDLRALSEINHEYPLSRCRMWEARTLFNFKLAADLHGKKLEFREQLEELDHETLFSTLKSMYLLGFRDHPAAQESRLPARHVLKSSTTKRGLVTALSHAFKLKTKSSIVDLQSVVPEE